MKLDEILSAAGKYKKRTRVGRGSGSGKGKTAGRGAKGYHSRAGSGKDLGFEGGQNPLLARIPKRDLRRLMERIQAQADDPRPRGCEKLSSQERYRVRQGNYRIVYSIQDEQLTVWVVKAGHRREVYR